MNMITLPGSGRSTSQLAFGSSTLMAATGMRDSLALLESAYEAGIRHFDTAPYYGFGAAEGCVGEFLGRHKGDVTVTTKYGIPPARNQGLIGLARGMVKPLLKLIPGIKQQMGRFAVAVTKNSEGPAYTPDGARRSLDNSLRVLQVEHIDLWLLHEPSADDLEDDALLRFMEDSVRMGKVGAFGIGSEAAKIPTLYAERRAYCTVLQYEWGPMEKEGLYAGNFVIHHRVLAGCLSKLTARLQQDTVQCRQWSDEVGTDLSAPGILASLLLKAAMLGNSRGITLFSSKNKQNIVANAHIAADTELNRPAQRLQDLMRHQALQL